MAAPARAVDESWDWPLLRERCLREASRVLDDPAAAEDVVQEALLRGWRRRSTCASAESRLPWLLTITRREAHRWYSGPRGRRERALEEAPELEGAPLDEELVLERLAVRRAVARLSPEDRRLLGLRYGDDLTQAAIAEELRLPEGTVKVRLHRLRSRLQKELEP